LVPSPRTFPPARYAGSVGKCRVGDWEYPAFVEEWWGRTALQRYQATASDPFDPATFDGACPVWLFERTQHPAVPFTKGECQVWKRIA
jgi:hypothetical protein